MKEGKVHRRIRHSCSHYTEPQKIHDRNYAIAEIRDKYLSRTKRGQKYYEMQATHYYENDEAYQAFLAEVEQKGLVKKLENKRLDTSTKQLFELGLIKGINTDDLDEESIQTKKLNRSPFLHMEFLQKYDVVHFDSMWTPLYLF